MFEFQIEPLTLGGFILILGVVVRCAMQFQKLQSKVSEVCRRMDRHGKVLLMITDKLIEQGIAMNPIRDELNNNEEEK